MVKLRGIPFRATPTDIAAFFAGYEGCLPHTAQIGTGADGRPSGEAWIAFTSDAAATRAVAERNNQHLGNRYVELFKE